MSSWWKDLGWWNQEEAYQAFDRYRREPTQENHDAAVKAALPLIRVVRSTQHLTLETSVDLDDLVSSAALTICKAMPKMAVKNEEQIGNNKQYMRYLFTCVLNAFYRELTIIQQRPNKIKARILSEHAYTHLRNPRDLRTVELQTYIGALPQHLYKQAEKMIRFSGERFMICSYILKQLIEDREISTPFLQSLGCTNKEFYTEYSKLLLKRSFLNIRKEVHQGLYGESDELGEDEA